MHREKIPKHKLCRVVDPSKKVLFGGQQWRIHAAGGGAGPAKSWLAAQI